MLNTAVSFSRLISNAGFDVPESSSLIKAPAKRPTYIVTLRPDGVVDNIIYLAANSEDQQKIRGYAENKFKMSPFCNVYPFYVGTEKLEKKGTIADCKRILAEAKPDADLDKKRLEAVTRSMETCGELIGKLGSVPSEFSLAALNKLFLSTTAESLLGNLLSYAKTQFEAGDAEMFDLLYGAVSRSSEMAKAVVLFDVVHKGVSLVSSPFAKYLNNAFVVNGKTIVGTRHIDAFGIEHIGEFEDTTIDINLPVLGGVILRTNNQDAPCKRRDDVEGPYPLSSTIQNDVHNALKFVTDPSKKDKLWAATPDGLLIGMAYQYKGTESEMVGTGEEAICDLLLPSPFVPEAKDAKLNEEVEVPFDAAEMNRKGLLDRVSAVIESVSKPNKSGKPTKVDPDLHFVFMMMSAYSRGQKGIDFTIDVTAESILEAAADWDKGCALTSEMLLNFPAKDKKKANVFRAKPHTPADLTRCLNTIYVRDGEQGLSPGKRYKLADAASVLLDKDDSMMVRNVVSGMLYRLLTGYASVVKAMGAATHKHERYKLAAYQMRFLPPSLGVLLYKLGERNVKTNPYYALGYLFNLCDQLQVIYCAERRNNDMPNVLVGQDFVTTAAINPNTAYDLSVRRCKIYLSTVKQIVSENSINPEKHRETTKDDGKDAFKVNGIGNMINVLNQYSDCQKVIGMHKYQDHFVGRPSLQDKAMLYVGYSVRTKKENLPEEVLVTV